MLNSFLNPWMLAGLAGIALPVIAHLLSRKKYDLVDWGAMQFLELDPNAKRKIRLEELLLMLVRIGLISLVALALARPWVGGEWVGRFVSTQSRDVVLVIDGSYSMGWEGKGLTPHAQAIQQAREYLKELLPGDSIQIIDAREQPRVVLPDATRDTYRARDALNELPAPAGSADLAAAVNRSIQLLTAGSNLQREVVVFTDLQALSWKADDAALWARFDDIQSQSPIAPRIWVLDAAHDDLGKTANFTIDRIQLSREMAVTGLPVKLSSKVKYSGGTTAITRKVHLEIDQQRLNDQTVQIKLQPQGETTVDFEYRFETPGTHLVSLVLDNDALPGDNRADTVVTVQDSLPVLFVDGDHKLDPTKCETYFARAALLATGGEHPWIKATVITPEELDAEKLKPMAVVVLANVTSLNEVTIDSLRHFAASGRGVLFTLGDKVTKDQYRSLLISHEGPELFPVWLESVVSEDGKEKRGVRVASSSLELPWLKPFRADRGASLIDARWSRWWKVMNPEHADPKDVTAPNPSIRLDSEIPEAGTAVVEIRLTTGDPLLVTRRFGRGITAVFTSTLDADWNTLPAKLDYVPFLHELLFSLASSTASRNVDVGSSLILAVSSALNVDEFQFLTPADKPLPAERIDDAFQTTMRLRTTTLPGVYQFVRKVPKQNEAARPEYFAVNFDRGESDVTTLTDAQRELLEGVAKQDDIAGQQGRMKFAADLNELRREMFSEGSRAELWWMLLYIFLASLAFETWMTRRMVLGGYAGQQP